MSGLTVVCIRTWLSVPFSPRRFLLFLCTPSSNPQQSLPASSRASVPHLASSTVGTPLRVASHTIKQRPVLFSISPEPLHLEHTDASPTATPFKMRTASVVGLAALAAFVFAAPTVESRGMQRVPSAHRARDVALAQDHRRHQGRRTLRRRAEQQGGSNSTESDDGSCDGSDSSDSSDGGDDSGSTDTQASTSLNNKGSQKQGTSDSNKSSSSSGSSSSGDASLPSAIQGTVEGKGEPGQASQIGYEV